MWLWMALLSALTLGFYDVVKKKALSDNGVLWVLFGATVLSTIFLSPWLGALDFRTHMLFLIKGVIVTTCWVSGLIGMKYLPLTTASTIKAFRPVLVVILSIFILSEKLNAWQWIGVVLAILAMQLLRKSSADEGISFSNNKGVIAMIISVLTGAGSAIYDKFLIVGMAPTLVQSWSNLYIALLLGITILVVGPKKAGKFTWDWKLLIIAVLITVSDALYFFALKQDGAMLSIISMLRRCSVIVTFATSAIVFKEKNIKSKAVDLAFMIAGMAFLIFGS